MTRRLWSALFAFLALPGMVAFAIPLALLGVRPTFARFAPVGLLPLVPGLALLLVCVREFYVAGRGTLAPWSPPRELVVSGPYRFSRNPMYIAVALVLWGWALGFHSRTLAVYALGVMLAFHLRVVLAEERFLARTQGGKWRDYKARVPRWLPIPRSKRGRR